MYAVNDCRTIPDTAEVIFEHASGMLTIFSTFDVEEGHCSTSYALLANIALATKARLDWDAHSERFTNNDAANELLDYEYHQPWSHV